MASEIVMKALGCDRMINWIKTKHITDFEYFFIQISDPIQHASS